MDIGPEILWPVGTLILGIAIGYGLVAYRTRNKANDVITDIATREQYDHPRRYEAETKDVLKDAVRD